MSWIAEVFQAIVSVFRAKDALASDAKIRVLEAKLADAEKKKQPVPWNGEPHEQNQQQTPQGPRCIQDAIDNLEKGASHDGQTSLQRLLKSIGKG